MSHDVTQLSTPLLEIESLTRAFPSGESEVLVLKGINLRIQAGEMLAIVGASGSGKSTLMNILGCLDRPSSGSYRVAGRDVGALSNDELAQLRREYFGFIFQRYHLLSTLNAVGNVEMPAIYAGIDRHARHARAQALLCRLGLSDRTTHRPNQLSGGQQQRVSIARALMNGGDVILADEPTGALDSKSGQEVMQILRELNDCGHTIILVTHDMHVAQHADRIIEIHDGEIVRDGPNPDNTEHSLSPGQVRDKKTMPLGKPSLPKEGNSVVRFLKGWGRFAEAFKMAWRAMVSHRMRTLLTMLGIIIGITAVVSVVALGQGTRDKIISDISAMGTNTIDIYPGRSWGDDKASTIYTLKPADMEALSQLFFVDSITPSVSGSMLLRYGNIKASASVSGVGDQYFRVRGLNLAQGTVFRSEDVQRQAQVVVIDHNTRKKLFADYEDPVGKVILVGSLPCTVIGVTEEKQSAFGNNQNLSVWVPYTSAMGRLFGRQYFNNITVRVRDNASMKAAEQVITEQLTLRHRTKDFFTSNSDSIMQTVEKTTGVLALLISSIAVISLIVGGIGVMNIMLVSVTERTHEIGIRMAVGGRQADILQQFLIEAVLVCLIGGLMGILLSFFVGFVFSLFVKSFSMNFSALSIVMAFLCSTLIGIIFGFLPARNAARLDPIQALARE